MHKLLTAGLLLLLLVPHASAISEEALLDSIQRTSFAYFWNEANPSNGLVKDRDTGGSPASIASVGFGLSAICVAIDHGWITRAQGVDRVLTTLQTFWTCPQNASADSACGYRGLFYHFLDMNTGLRAWSSELSTIDTGLLFAGILHAREYFDTNDSLDIEIRAIADSITQRAEWDFTWTGGGIKMGWTPETGFNGFGEWVGYNEAMIMYIIAFGSPTHPVPGVAWNTWTNNYFWGSHYGYQYVEFPPLFGHQYSHCWIDFRNIHDTYMQNKGITYFENSRRATLAQRAYCIDNPGNQIGYSDSLWGLTAGDGPFGYSARGAPPAQNDDGTITPTAAISSIPFAPEVCIPAARNMYNLLKAQLWGEYGFRDGFNLNYAWFASDVLGIDQGPMILGIENYLNNSIWDRFMQNADIIAGLQVAGFSVITDVADGPGANLDDYQLLTSTPNPFGRSTSIRFRIPSADHVTLAVYDVRGREVARLVDGFMPAGAHEATLSAAGLASGVYYYRLETGDRTLTKRTVLLK